MPSAPPAVPAKDVPAKDVPAKDVPAKTELATFAGGCYWCIEAVFEQIPGVLDAKSGFMGGDPRRITYREVCEGDTGHAEVVQLTFDPAKVSFEKLVEVFWEAHDPTSLNRQGADHGTQYRSAIFYHSDEQRRVAEASKAKLAATLEDPVVTEIAAAGTLYDAPEYHQDYYVNNREQGYCRVVIRPKLKKLGLKE